MDPMLVWKAVSTGRAPRIIEATESFSIDCILVAAGTRAQSADSRLPAVFGRNWNSTIGAIILVTTSLAEAVAMTTPIAPWAICGTTLRRQMEFLAPYIPTSAAARVWFDPIIATPRLAAV